MNIQITGATGFIGINLRNYLVKHQILPLSVRYISNQIISLDAEAIIHLAGKAHDLKGGCVEDYDDSNYKLTKQLFDAFLCSNNSRIFIFMSTVKAVADKIDVELTEEAPPNPQTPYGISKYKAEQYILKHKLPDNKKVYILRPCMVHGKGNKGNLNLLYSLINKGIPWPLGQFKNKRSFLSIENLCFVVEQLLKKENVPAGIYNVADDTPISTNDLVRLIGRTIKKHTSVLFISKQLISFLARVGDILHLSLNTERLQKLTENYVVSNNKIISVLKTNLPISVEDGLILTIKSFRSK